MEENIRSALKRLRTLVENFPKNWVDWEDLSQGKKKALEEEVKKIKGLRDDLLKEKGLEIQIITTPSTIPDYESYWEELRTVKERSRLVARQLAGPARVGRKLDSRVFRAAGITPLELQESLQKRENVEPHIVDTITNLHTMVVFGDFLEERMVNLAADLSFVRRREQPQPISIGEGEQQIFTGFVDGLKGAIEHGLEIPRERKNAGGTVLINGKLLLLPGHLSDEKAQSR